MVASDRRRGVALSTSRDLDRASTTIGKEPRRDPPCSSSWICRIGLGSRVWWSPLCDWRFALRLCRDVDLGVTSRSCCRSSSWCHGPFTATIDLFIRMQSTHVRHTADCIRPRSAMQVPQGLCVVRDGRRRLSQQRSLLVGHQLCRLPESSKDRRMYTFQILLHVVLHLVSH